MSIDTTAVLTRVLAHIYKGFVLQKPGVGTLLSIALADGLEIKKVVDGLHDIPKEVLDINSEEAQELSAIFTHELDGAEGETKADEVFGRVLLLIPSVRDVISSIKDEKKDIELIVDSFYSLIKMALATYKGIKA